MHLLPVPLNEGIGLMTSIYSGYLRIRGCADRHTWEDFNVYGPSIQCMRSDHQICVRRKSLSDHHLRRGALYSPIYHLSMSTFTDLGLFALAHRYIVRLMGKWR
jgi:hypothetical protein